jgi:hypothetical protein
MKQTTVGKQSVKRSSSQPTFKKSTPRPAPPAQTQATQEKKKVSEDLIKQIA